MKWFDPELNEIQSALDKTLGAGNNRIISWSRDRQKLLIEVGDASQAGALYYWDTNGADLQRVAWNNEVLKDRKLSPVTTVEYKARDGTQIEAVLTLPRGRDAHSLPLIVMPHGGPGARDDEEYDWWAQYLAERGYAVVQPNYRGSTGYGSAFHDLGKGEWGLKMQDDSIDCIDFLAEAGHDRSEEGLHRGRLPMAAMRQCAAPSAIPRTIAVRRPMPAFRTSTRC